MLTIETLLATKQKIESDYNEATKKVVSVEQEKAVNTEIKDVVQLSEEPEEEVQYIGFFLNGENQIEGLRIIDSLWDSLPLDALERLKTTSDKDCKFITAKVESVVSRVVEFKSTNRI